MRICSRENVAVRLSQQKLLAVIAGSIIDYKKRVTWVAELSAMPFGKR
jgi:hypothetical protein